jgi:hypothetical protein
MVEYRLFSIDRNNRIVGAPTVISCADDAHAVAKAKVSDLGSKVEVWPGSRVVAVLTRAGGR